MPTAFYRLTEIDPLEWNRLAGDNAFATYGWLLTVERCSRGPVQPIYFIHREQGVAVAAAVCYVVWASTDVETLDDMIYGRVAAAASALGSSFLPAFVCGPALGYGWHIGLDAALDRATRRNVCVQMVEAMEAAARDRRLTLHFVHAMPDERELLCDGRRPNADVSAGRRVLARL